MYHNDCCVLQALSMYQSVMNADRPQNVLRLNPENPVFVCQNHTVAWNCISHFPYLELHCYHCSSQVLHGHPGIPRAPLAVRPFLPLWFTLIISFWASYQSYSNVIILEYDQNKTHMGSYRLAPHGSVGLSSAFSILLQECLCLWYAHTGLTSNNSCLDERDNLPIMPIFFKYS